MSLPSGQDVARAMSDRLFKDEELKVGKVTTLTEDDALPSIDPIWRSISNGSSIGCVAARSAYSPSESSG
jgi:hypothetical protein